MNTQANPILQGVVPRPGVAGKVLLVDDDRMGLAMLKSVIENGGYFVETAANGAEAYALMRENPRRVDLIISDRMMPVMDGLTLTRRLKREKETADIPIVLLTGATETEDIRAGIEAGAFYYLTKPAQPGVVSSVLEAAMREVVRKRQVSEELGAHQSAFANVDVLRLSLSRPEEVEPCCSLLASVSGNPEKIVQGIYELVQNAVEHGLYRFGLDAKARLLTAGRWSEALKERSHDPAFQGGAVEATILKRDGAMVLTVKDPGPGFQWQPFLSADPSRSSVICGRGIARANTFVFDRLLYNPAGNEATAIMQLEKKSKW